MIKQSPKSRFSFLHKEFGIKKEKNQFIENLALMLSSGIDIVSALESLHEEVKSKSIRKIIESVYFDIQNGLPVWKAFENSKLLAPNLISIIKIGENSGNLQKNLQIVIGQQQKEAEFRSKLQAAALYPGIVLLVMTVVGVFVSVFVIPRLTNVYSSLNIELPSITKFLISFGNFMEKNAIIVVPLFAIILVTLIYFTFIFKKTKFIGQKIAFNTPIIKGILQELQLSKFGYFSYILLDSGFPMNETLKILSDASEMHQYKKLYQYLFLALTDGFTFNDAFQHYKGVKKLLPLYPRQLIVNGEKTGNLAESFLQIGQTFEKKNDLTTKNLGTLFEPILLILVWVGVAGLALSVILPIYSLIGNFSSVSQGTTQTAQ